MNQGRQRNRDITNLIKRPGSMRKVDEETDRQIKQKTITDMGGRAREIKGPGKPPGK